MSTSPRASTPPKQVIGSDASIVLEDRKEKKDEVYYVFEVRVGHEKWHVMRLLSQIESLREMLHSKYSEFIALPELTPPAPEGFFSWLSFGNSDEQQQAQKRYIQDFLHFVFQSDILRNDEATLNFIKPIRELSENEEHLEITIRSVKYAHNNLLDPFLPNDTLEPTIYLPEPSQETAVASPGSKRKAGRQYTEDEIARLRGIMKTMSTEKISRRKRTESQENLLNITRAKLYAAVGSPE